MEFNLAFKGVKISVLASLVLEHFVVGGFKLHFVKLLEVFLHISNNLRMYVPLLRCESQIRLTFKWLRPQLVEWKQNLVAHGDAREEK